MAPDHVLPKLEHFCSTDLNWQLLSARVPRFCISLWHPPCALELAASQLHGFGLPRAWQLQHWRTTFLDLVKTSGHAVCPCPSSKKYKNHQYESLSSSKDAALVSPIPLTSCLGAKAETEGDACLSCFKVKAEAFTAFAKA